MITSNCQHGGEVIRWMGRLWSLPLIVVTFLLAAGPFFPGQSLISKSPFLFGLASPHAMVYAVAFVVAWRWEKIGGWIALASAVTFKVWFAIRTGHFSIYPVELLIWPPAVLFLLCSTAPVEPPGNAPAQESGAEQAVPPRKKPRRYFALPRTNLGWWSLLVGAGFFIFMRLFWMQASSPGRDRSTFFSDPINAGCLIGAFASPIIGMIMAIIAIIWKRERSLLLIPLLLLGLFALLWTLAVLSGANA